MRQLSTRFSERLSRNASLIAKATLTLADGRTVELTGDDIVGITREQATSSDSSFDIGGAVIGKCGVTLNNHDERFSSYDFTGSTIVPYVGATFGEYVTRGGTWKSGISVQVSEAVDGTLSASVYRDGIPLSDQEVAMLGTLVWYEGGVRAGTGRTLERGSRVVTDNLWEAERVVSSEPRENGVYHCTGSRGVRTDATTPSTSAGVTVDVAFSVRPHEDGCSFAMAGLYRGESTAYGLSYTDFKSAAKDVWTSVAGRLSIPANVGMYQVVICNSKASAGSWDATGVALRTNLPTRDVECRLEA
jgi:hypothetical protein